MKKLLVISAMCLAMTAQATILRVSNVSNSGAPYSDVSSAMAAAVSGDTIMVDGSTVSYSDVTIDRKIVLMGPGYWRAENGVIQEGTNPATFSAINFKTGSAGSIITGIVGSTVAVNTDHITITRCRIQGNITHSGPSTASNTVIHQCFLEGSVRGYGTIATNRTPNVQITNNIFTGKINSDGLIYALTDSYIAYNTFTNEASNVNYADESSVYGSTIEKNVAFRFGSIDTNTYNDNYVSNNIIYHDTSTDLAIKNQVLSDDVAAQVEGKGAFSGDDPYVISGIPAGPVIQDITVPATVEQGGTLNITIKLGIQK